MIYAGIHTLNALCTTLLWERTNLLKRTTVHRARNRMCRGSGSKGLQSRLPTRWSSVTVIDKDAVTQVGRKPSFLCWTPGLGGHRSPDSKWVNQVDSDLLLPHSFSDWQHVGPLRLWFWILSVARLFSLLLGMRMECKHEDSALCCYNRLQSQCLLGPCERDMSSVLSAVPGQVFHMLSLGFSPIKKCPGQRGSGQPLSLLSICKSNINCHLNLIPEHAIMTHTPF